MTYQSNDIITSSRNPRVVAARKLAHRKHRTSENSFLAEGLQVLHLALESGACAAEVFYCDALLASESAWSLLYRLQARGAALIPVAERVLRLLSDRSQPQGLVARFTRPDTSLDRLALRPGSLVIVLDRPQYPGNVGTLIRTADAVGANAVILLEPCADPFDPKAIRSSMGSLFCMPVACAPDVHAVFHCLRAQGLRVVGADAHQGVTWGAGLLMGGVALMLGNEARGLSADVCAGVDAWVRLPVLGRADSLNVAVAGGVLMYAWLQANL